ncbi:hypothetical protein H0H92_009689, partial [Tricholoma furcatifolium]
MDIAVVPRVVFPPPPRKRKAKGKDKAEDKPTKPPRPPQRILDMQALFDLGEPQVTGANRWVRGRDHEDDAPHWSSGLSGVPKILRNEVFDWDGEVIVTSCHYKGKEYYNGFRVLTTTHYVPTIPKRHELETFKEFSIISPHLLVSTEQFLDALQFSADDPVKVVAGQQAGAVGSIVEVDHQRSIALVEVLDGPSLEIDTASLRKNLLVGDEVLVVDGMHQGFIGWIVGIGEKGLSLFNHTTAEGVIVAPHQVMFYEPPKTIYTQTKPDVQQAPQDFHFSKMKAQDIAPLPDVPLPPLQIQNPHQRFVGREVIITKGPFKDYRGFVKNTERGDLVNVEIQPNLIQTIVHRQYNLTDLAHVNDPYLRPLSTFASSLEPIPTFKPFETPEEPAPLSSMPLIPSTPIPESSSAAMGRAWNPSSRTPMPGSSFPCNPWMEAPKLPSNVRVSLEIRGTKPVLKDPGWKYGDMEGMRALWK